MAKGIEIKEYRGLKVRRGKKMVMHLTDENGKKLHVRFTWKSFDEMVRDFSIWRKELPDIN